MNSCGEGSRINPVSRVGVSGAGGCLEEFISVLFKSTWAVDFLSIDLGLTRDIEISFNSR